MNLLIVYVFLFIIVWIILGIKLGLKKISYLKSMGITLTVIVVGFLIGIIPTNAGKCGDKAFYIYNIYKTAGVYGKGTIYVDVPDDLNKLITNNGTEKIGSCREYKNLKYVRIADTVVDICNYAFGECENLENIIIPNKDIEIAYNAFKGCKRIADIQLQDNVHIYEDTYYTYCQYYNFNEGFGLTDRGFIDKNGNTVIDFKYDYASDFSEGLAVVKKDGKYGYIDKNGDAIIDFKYTTTRWFGDGLAFIRSDSEYGFIDKEGNIVIDNKIRVEKLEI